MARLTIADARKVSGAQFMEAFFGSYEDKRQAHIERCIRIIENGGDLYGWPPAMVDHCKVLIAARALDTEPFSELKQASGWL